jgi:predicted transcriptional regulator
MLEPKEIKAEIRRLRKIKLQCKAGSVERLDLGRKIKDLKKQLAEITAIEPGKEKLIAEILTLEPSFPQDLVNLNKFTEQELQKHIECIKRKGGIK